MELTRCSRGQYFGELALVTNKPRAASAYAVGDVKLLGKMKCTLTHSFNVFVTISTHVDREKFDVYLKQLDFNIVLGGIDNCI